jgi:hypothetical protein
MKYPGYGLNPGDMFQVEPELVLFATGARKSKAERYAGRLLRKKNKQNNLEASTESSPPNEGRLETQDVTSGDLPDVTEAESKAASKATLQSLLDQARTILSSSKNELSAKRKQDLRAFTRTVRSCISRIPKVDNAEDLDAQVSALVSRLSLSTSSPVDGTESASANAGEESVSDADKERLKQAIQEARENPIDDSKSYATPWRPREYMSAFAFIPRYLEVNQNICSAVYLRHPVARPGLAEVPTPFHPQTHQLAFNWYLRRR